MVLPEERFDTVALLPADLPLAVHDNLNLKDRCDFPFVLTEAGSSELVSRLFTAARLPPNIRYRCSQLMSTLDVVARGGGVTVGAEGSLPAQLPRANYHGHYPNSLWEAYRPASC
jgi:DNA-binding transcriptional LysR family regulator